MPLPTEMPTFPGPAELLGLAAAGDLPAFLDQPAFPGQPPIPGQPALPVSSTPAGGPARPTRSGRRRARVAAVAAVAVVAAAVAGWFAYPRPASVDAASGSPPAAAGSGTVVGGANATGRSAAQGTAGTGGAMAPAGYRWVQVSAASSGTTAGFQVAVPASWTVSRQGLVTYLRPAAGNAYIEISLASFGYLRPLRETAFLQAQAIQQGTYPGYRLAAIKPGTLLGTPDAVWRFSWQGGGAARTGVLEVLASIDTAAGTQPYTLAVSAPSDAFPAAEAAFRDVMQTFRPLA